MKPMTTNLLHQPETEFNGEIQAFFGPALAPGDPTSIEPRIRKGRPTDQRRRESTDENGLHDGHRES